MSVHKLIQVNTNGTHQEYAGKNTSSGVGDAGEFIIADSNGKLDPSFLPSGVGEDSVVATASEALNAGDLVYFNGTGNVLKADATTIAKAARGYVNVAVSNGALATVFFDDSNIGKTGLTAGATYYLDHTTPGGVTTTPTTTAGQIVQAVGFATSATNLRVNIEEPIIRA